MRATSALVRRTGTGSCSSTRTRSRRRTCLTATSIVIRGRPWARSRARSSRADGAGDSLATRYAAQRNFLSAARPPGAPVPAARRRREPDGAPDGVRGSRRLPRRAARRRGHRFLLAPAGPRLDVGAARGGGRPAHLPGDGRAICVRSGAVTPPGARGSRATTRAFIRSRPSFAPRVVRPRGVHGRRPSGAGRRGRPASRPRRSRRCPHPA